MSRASDQESRFRDLVRSRARDAVAFQGLGEGMRVWLDGDREAAVAYFDTGSAWVTAGGPVCEARERGEVAHRFATAAREAGRRPVLFAVEDLAGLSSWAALPIGQQASHTPPRWARAVKDSRALREQLRRARAKGVAARVVAPGDLAAGTPLRGLVDELVAHWVAARRIEPMAFLVAPDPHRFPEEHAYVVARRGDAVVGLLSAVPAYAGEGWLVEHLLVAPDSPNGTAETLLAALHAELTARGAPDAVVSLGLAPLAGEVPRWQAAVRTLARPLFDFEGLRSFKARLRPSEWRPVWLVVPAGSSRLVAVVDTLTAFAGGSLLRFALRSLFLRPRGLLWLLAIGLVPWTALLLFLDVTHEEGVAGYSSGALLLWIVFDVLLATGLFRAALRPAYRALLLLTLAAFTDAVLSSIHLRVVGLGPTLPDSVLRFAQAVAPTIGTATLVYIAVQRARELARSRTRA